MIDEVQVDAAVEATAAPEVIEPAVAPHPANSAIEALESEWVRFHDWFVHKLADIRAQL